jgi:hypothetical protein
MAQATPKICTVCGCDCSRIERFKDPHGQYRCGPCEKSRRRAAPAAVGAGVGAASDADGSLPSGEIFALADLAQMEAAATTAAPPAMRCCTNCGHAIGSAIICTSCGFNTQTRQMLTGAKPTKPAKVAKARNCGKCGYSLAGLETPVCPECGTISLPKTTRDKDRDHSRKVVRNAYIAPIMTTIIGLGIAMMVYAGSGENGAGVALFFLLKYSISVPIGVFGFFLCCWLWIGFDAPMHLTALRLAGVYAVVDAVVALFSLIGFPILMMPIVVQLIVYGALLSKALDLDIQDAVLVAVFTTILRYGAFIMIVVYLSNEGYI